MKRIDFVKSLVCLPLIPVLSPLDWMLNKEIKPAKTKKLDLIEPKTNDVFAFHNDSFNQHNILSVYKDNKCAFYIDENLQWQPEAMNCPVEAGQYLSELLKVFVDKPEYPIKSYSSNNFKLTIEYDHILNLYLICCNYPAYLDTMMFFKTWIECNHQNNFGDKDCNVIYSTNNGKTYNGFLKFSDAKNGKYNSKI